MKTPYTVILSILCCVMAALLQWGHPPLSLGWWIYACVFAYAAQAHIEVAKDLLRPWWKRWRQYRDERTMHRYDLSD